MNLFINVFNTRHSAWRKMQRQGKTIEATILSILVKCVVVCLKFEFIREELLYL